MRKALMCLIAFCAFAFAAAPALAGTVQLTGKHSREEIKSTCAANGGLFDGEPNQNYDYACFGPKGTVACKNSGVCAGSCEQCGKAASRFTFGGLLWNVPFQPFTPFLFGRPVATPTGRG